MKETGLAQAGQSGSSASIEYTLIRQEIEDKKCPTMVFFSILKYFIKKRTLLRKNGNHKGALL